MIADELEVTDIEIPTVTLADLPGSLSEGMLVCFTGQVLIDGTLITRVQLEAMAALVGLQPVSSVTRKGCDLLVAADTSSRSGKAKKAHEYGIPIVAAEEFLALLSRRQDGNTHGR